MTTLPKLIAILGPTASGKTDLSIELAKKFNGEIVSADSRQVYREFTVGTAKPEGSWKVIRSGRVYIAGGIPHYLVDEVDPKEEFTVVDFKKRAGDAIDNIISRHKFPFVVGGTALYAYALLDNLDIPEVPPQPAFRSRLEKRSADDLYAELLKKDPEAARITGPNKRRIIRALEVIEKTGKKFSAQRTKGPKLFNALKIGVGKDVDTVYARALERIEQMMAAGLLDEVKALSAKYDWSIPPMQSIGYQEFRECLEGNEPLGKALSRLRARYKDFIRRQMLWFKRDKDIIWVKDKKEAEQIVNKFIDTPLSSLGRQGGQ